MKRRAISFLIALALCLSLCPIRVLAADDKYPDSLMTTYVDRDTETAETLVVNGYLKFDTMGCSFTVSAGPAVRVPNGAKLYLTYGTIESTAGVGIEVQSEGFLRVMEMETGMTVIGKTYGLDIASGAEAQLSGGTFKGEQGAIRLQGADDADVDYSTLLASADGTYYAYFNGDGEPIPLADVDGEKTVTVKECTNHEYDYTPDAYTPGPNSLITHSGICEYCGAPSEPEMCTFNFTESNSSKCDYCDHTITIDITIDKDSLVYDGNDKADSVSVQVVLGDGKDDRKTLNEEGANDYSYTVEPLSPVNVGKFTVTVTGKSYTGTFEKTFSITKAQPVITWDTSPKTMDYDGDPVKATELPTVTITAKTDSDKTELGRLLTYSHKKTADGNGVAVADTGFVDGLPTDAGTYDIIANLPETQNYTAASSDPITLTINKVSPFKNNDVPKANTLTYNGTVQELVSRGTLWDGAVVLFATSEAGPWSTNIPTGTNAGLYEVWFVVEETKNCNGASGLVFPGVEIQRKPIKPVVELEYESYQYDGGAIQPKVTAVRDPYTWEPLPTSEYTVEYINNVNVGGPQYEAETEAESEPGDEAGTQPEDKYPTVIVKDPGGGNYQIAEVKETLIKEHESQIYSHN